MLSCACSSVGSMLQVDLNHPVCLSSCCCQPIEILLTQQSLQALRAHLYRALLTAPACDNICVPWPRRHSDSTLCLAHLHRQDACCIPRQLVCPAASHWKLAWLLASLMLPPNTDTDICPPPACRFSTASIALYMLQGYLPWVDAVARVIQPEVYQQRADCLLDPAEVSALFQPVCNGSCNVQVLQDTFRQVLC